MGLAFLYSILDCFHQRSFSSRPILEILLPIQSFAKTTLEANLVIWYVRIVNLFCTCLYMTNDSGTFGQFFGFPPLTSSGSPWTPLATAGLTPLKRRQRQYYHWIHSHRMNEDHHTAIIIFAITLPAEQSWIAITSTHQYEWQYHNHCITMWICMIWITSPARQYWFARTIIVSIVIKIIKISNKYESPLPRGSLGLPGNPRNVSRRCNGSVRQGNLTIGRK